MVTDVVSMAHGYEMFKADFLATMSSAEDRMKHCPFKTCMVLSEVDGVAVERFTVMPSNDTHGNFGAKTIYVNDVTGEYKETYILNNHPFDYTGFTIKRCAMMCKLVAELMCPDYERVGFIGNGRVNLATKELLSPKQVVIHGAKGREGNHKELFGDCIVDVDFSELNSCDIVFVCTNSYSQELLVSGDQLKARLVVVLDCGYTINEDFRRNYKLFSDYPEQLKNQYSEEFPFDAVEYDYQSLDNLTPEVCKNSNVCVYLHGCAINDLSMAKIMHPEYVND